LPVFFRVFQESHQINIVKEVDFAKTHQIGKCPIAFEPLFNHCNQKIHDQYTVNLDFDGVFIISLKVF